MVGSTPPGAAMIELLHMDCMDYMKGLKDNAFDLAIVDPPYFEGFEKMGYCGKKSSSIGVKRGTYDTPNWDKDLPTPEYFSQLARVSKNQIIWGINYFGDLGHHPAGRIVWDKVKDSSSFSKCEIASCSLIDTVQIFRFMWNGMQQGTPGNGSIMQGNKKLNERRIHPTQKPVQLYRWTLQEFALLGWRILDTHLGSGSSALAAWELGYDFVGMEKYKAPFKAAQKRFKLVTAQTRMVL